MSSKVHQNVLRSPQRVLKSSTVLNDILWWFGWWCHIILNVNTYIWIVKTKWYHPRPSHYLIWYFYQTLSYTLVLNIHCACAWKTETWYDIFLQYISIKMTVYRSREIPLRLRSSSNTAATLLRPSVFPVSASSFNKTCKLFTRSFNFPGRNLMDRIFDSRLN